VPLLSHRRSCPAPDGRGVRSPVLEQGCGNTATPSTCCRRRTGNCLTSTTRHDYEVVLLDWRMPKMTRVDAVGDMRLRGEPTPVLMLTARDATEDRALGMKLRADDYLVSLSTLPSCSSRSNRDGFSCLLLWLSSSRRLLSLLLVNIGTLALIHEIRVDQRCVSQKAIHLQVGACASGRCKWSLGDTIRTGAKLCPVRPSGSGESPSPPTGSS